MNLWCPDWCVHHCTKIENIIVKIFAELDWIGMMWTQRKTIWWTSSLIRKLITITNMKFKSVEVLRGSSSIIAKDDKIAKLFYFLLIRNKCRCNKLNFSENIFTSEFFLVNEKILYWYYATLGYLSDYQGMYYIFCTMILKYIWYITQLFFFNRLYWFELEENPRVDYFFSRYD